MSNALHRHEIATPKKNASAREGPRAPRDQDDLASVPAAAWTIDGSDIVWVEGLGEAAAVHLIRPDGTNDRLVSSFAGTPGSEII